MYTLGDGNENSKTIQKIVQSLIADTTAHQARRLQTLVTLFNLTLAGESKCEILNGMLTRAISIWHSL